MILNELYNNTAEKYQDVDSDNSSPDEQSTRKTRLTLKQINKLRQMLDLRNVEYKEKLQKVQLQYNSQPDGAEGGF
jgi:hypothetical protein